MWDRIVSPAIERFKEEMQGDRMYAWLQLFGCLIGCVVCSGLTPGAVFWIKMLGQDAEYEQLCDPSNGPCDRPYRRAIAVFVVCGAISSLILMPLLVLLDYMGTRIISFIGGVLVILGQVLFFTVLIPGASSSDVVFYLVLSLAVLCSETGAHMVNTVIQGFAWHLDDARDIVFVLFALSSNLSGLLPLLIRVFYVMIMQKWPGLGPGQVTGLSYLAYLCLPGVGLTLMFLCAIPQDEFMAAAGEVLDIAIPSPSFSFGSIGRVLKNTQQVLHYDTSFHRSHIVFVIVLALNTTWALIYIYFAGSYGSDLFRTADNPNAEDTMATMVLVSVCTIGAAMAIAGTLIVGKYGMVPIVCMMIGAQVIATFTITGELWIEQVITTWAASFVLGLAPIMVSRHMWHYSPPKVFGPTYILLNCYRICVSALVVILSLIPVTMIGKRTTFVFMLSVSMGSMVFYLIYIKIKDFPTSVPLIKHEVDDLCCSYCCRDLTDVLYIMGMESTPAAIKMLTSAGPELYTQLVTSINPDRVQEMMMKLTMDEIDATLRRGPAWSDKNDGARIEGSISNFAMTPQLWSQFMHDQIDMSVLTRRKSKDAPPVEEFPNPFNSAVAVEEKKEAMDIGPAAQSALAQNIMRAMNARVHTKELIRILRQQDKKLLEDWMTNKDTSLMCEALWDMIDWDNGLEAVYTEEGKEQPRTFDKFKAMLPFTDLADSLARRPDLKNFAIEVLKADLKQAIQTEQARKVAKMLPQISSE